MSIKRKNANGVYVRLTDDQRMLLKMHAATSQKSMMSLMQNVVDEYIKSNSDVMQKYKSLINEVRNEKEK